MPIYTYKCESCGHAKDVLQKMSDPLLTDCPACRQATFKKQLTAAGFQLKGTGWYVTDFKEGAGKNTVPPTEAKTESTGSTTAALSTTETTVPVTSPIAKTESTSSAASAPSTATAAPSAAKATPSSNV